MGKSSERSEASGNKSQSDSFNCREAHNVGRRSKEDCGSTASALGESKGRTEEGGLDLGLL